MRPVFPLMWAGLALAAMVPSTADAAGRTEGSRCAPARPAVAHYPGAVAVDPQPAGQPVPCVSYLGRSSESALVGTRNGAVFYAPIVGNTFPAPFNTIKGPENVTRSLDGGGTWSLLDSGGPTTGGQVPPWMHVDPKTGRIWFVTTLANWCGARISWSDDGGDTWATNRRAGCPGMGSERILEGPAPPGGAQPVGYPHVVYYCGNLSDITVSVLYCYRSLDGGRTFQPIRRFPDFARGLGSHVPGRCGVAHIATPGTVGPDGTLYFPLNVCGTLRVAISRDEGSTWRAVPVAPKTHVADIYISSTTTDTAGNVYIAWMADDGAVNRGVMGSGLPYMSMSRDGGRSWSAPMMIGPPGVTEARHPAITATGTGRVAVAYIGSADGGRTVNGYITLTEDALVDRPVFSTQAVNDPDKPLMSGGGAGQLSTFGNRLFVLSDTFDAQGRPWAGFHCVNQKMCPNKRIGVLGSLAPAVPSPG